MPEAFLPEIKTSVVYKPVLILLLTFDINSGPDKSKFQLLARQIVAPKKWP